VCEPDVWINDRGQWSRIFLMPTSDLVFRRNHCTCGSEDVHILFQAADINFGATRQKAAVLRCTTCGSFYPEKFPDQESLGAAYANYYTAAVPKRSLLGRLLGGGREDYLSREAPSDGAILDYGCGSGAYLNQRAAVSPSAELYGSDVYPGTDDGAFTWLRMNELEGRKFRHITLSHVLEHVPDPAALFARLATLLQDNGTLWIATPNAQSFLIDIYGPHARDVDFPRHRIVLSRQELERLAGVAGLAVTWRPSPFLNTVINGVQSARNLWNDPATNWGVRIAAVARTIKGGLRWVLLPSEERGRRTPETVALLRKARPA
jgi:SAM-dependent methyltransferase